MDFTAAIPNQLLLVSLLEHLCFIYERNPRRSIVLFKLLCQKLAELHLISPMAFSDELSTVRLQHNQTFTKLLRAASKGLSVQGRATSEEVHPQIRCRTKETLYQGQTSRFVSEFEEIARLGKGSYGKVYKVRNKLDGQFYALKKILMKKFTKLGFMKVLREVKVLAGLQHPYIVGYHTAWIEHLQPLVLKSNQVSLSNLYALKGLPAQGGGGDPAVHNTQTSSSSIIFADPSSAMRLGEPLSGCRLVEEEVLVNSSKEDVKKTTIQSEASGVKLPANSGQRRLGIKDFGRHLPCLYSKDLSMYSDTDLVSKRQICQDRRYKLNSLVEAFETETQDLEMNKELGCDDVEISGSSVNPSSNSTSESDSSFTDVLPVAKIPFHLVLHIQMQLCEGSLQEWILERNTRPRKGLKFTCQFALLEFDCTMHIFRQLVEGVRFIHSKGVMHRDLKPRNIFLHAPDCHVRIGDFGLACSDIVETSDSWTTKNEGPDSKHTSGVGTCLYASPEQLKGSRYDFKSDMYSVGIILLELFHPFGTAMERAKVIMALREGYIPKDIAQWWPLQAKYIKMLTSKDASHRPSADEMLDSELFSSLKLTPLQEKLNQKVVTQEQEIKTLQQKLIDREEEIRHLKEQVKLLAREGESR
ncbi:eukaryotic translation initiation factor 2-alpha kinase 1 isoform X2 [Rhinoraja longicauda]